MRIHTQGGPKPQEAASHFPLGPHGMMVDPHNPFMRSGSDVQPTQAFSMFQKRVADAKAGAQGRDMALRFVE